MTEEAVKISKKKDSFFIDKVKELLPEGGNLNACLTCGLCSSGCPATGFRDMDPRKFLRMAALGMDEEIKASPWVWMCSMCQRCIYVCPMQINIPQLVFNARKLTPREERPKGIVASCDMALKVDTCSAMGAGQEDFEFVVEDILEEVREEQPLWEERDLQAPIDKKGAKFFLNQNSREPVTEPEEMVPLWKILNMVGADWTYGSEGWAAENYCLFMSDDEGWEHVTRKSVGKADELGCEIFLNTEWGHITFSVLAGLKKFNIDHNVEVATIYNYYAQWIREGKLPVSSDWNKELGVKFTLQDPCQIVRKTFGDKAADDARYVLKACVGEENFIDMYPNKSNNFCCGGGGGYLQSGFKEERLEYGRIKDNQIKATGADYVITGCHNCHAQVHDLSEHYEGHYHVAHMWTIICLAMGVLGENERTYLGPDLAEVNMPE